MKDYKVGDSAFLVVSNSKIIEVTIVSIRGDFYVIRFPYGGGTQLKGHRLYASKEEAKLALPIEKQNQRRNCRSPYDHFH